MKKISAIIMLMTLTLFSGVSFSAEIKKNPAAQNFNVMYNYWISNKKISSEIANTTVQKVLSIKDDDILVFSYLFIMSKSSKTEEKRKEASEGLSSFCYEYQLRENTLNKETNISKCIDGTQIDAVSNIINAYYQYQSSKKYWETVAYQCIQNDFNKGRSVSVKSGGFKTIESASFSGDPCSSQLSAKAYSNLALPYNENVVTSKTGTESGVYYGNSNKSLASLVYEVNEGRGKRNLEIANICGSNAQIDMSRYDDVRIRCGYKTCKRRYKYAFCVTNPYTEIYKSIQSKCAESETFLKGAINGVDGFYNYDTLCGNWSKSGLSSSSNFFRAVQASVIPNQNLKTPTSTTGGDPSQSNRYSALRKYWDDNNSGVPEGYSNRFSTRGFERNSPSRGWYQSSWRPTTAQLGTSTAKVGLLLQNRNNFTQGTFTSDNGKTPDQHVSNMTYEYHYPLKNADEKSSIINFLEYSKVYDLKGETVNWLTTETNWKSANGYNCSSKVLDHNKTEDLLYASGSEIKKMYGQKEMKSRILSKYGSLSVSPRAQTLSVKSGNYGLIPHSKNISLNYTVCEAR